MLRFLFLMLFLPIAAFSQTNGYAPEVIFNMSNPNYYKEKISEVYKGHPIVKIENPNYLQKKDNLPRLKPLSQEELSQNTAPLNLSYEVKTPFGEKRTAGYINHTTDFYTKIQILDNNAVFVQEFIQFITTKDTDIQRVIPTYFKGVNTLKPLHITLNSFEKNNKQIPYVIDEKEDEFIISGTKKYPAGLHILKLSYIIHNAIQKRDGKNRLFISLTGLKWPLPVERFKVLVLHPYKPTSFEKGLLFGSNNLNIANSFNMVTDNKGSTAYRLKQPLPAYADVKLYEIFTENGLATNFNEFFFEKFKFILFPIFAFLSLTFYLILSYYYLKKIEKRKRNILKRINTLPFFVLTFLNHKKLTVDNLTAIKKIQKLNKKSTIILTLVIFFLKNRFLRFFIQSTFNLLAMFVILFKYLITGIVILTVFITPLVTLNSLNIYVMIALCIFYILAYTLFYKKVLIPDLKNEISVFNEKILSPHICFGLKETTIKSFYLRYYRTAYLLNIHDKLKDIILFQNKNLNLPTV